MLVLEAGPTTVYSLAISPDGEVIVAGTKDNHLWVWGATGVVHEPIEWKQGAVTAQAIAFRPGSDWAYIGYDTDLFRWRNVRTGEQEGGGYVFDGAVTALAFVGPELLAVGTGSRVARVGGQFTLWDVTTRRFRKPTFDEPAGVRAVAAHPDSRTVAWANASNRVSVWETTRQDPVHFPQTHSSPSVAFHPDGHTVAAAVDYTIKLYAPADRRERRTLAGHKGRVMAVAFSPDGRWLASGGWDGTVRLWDWAGGTERQVFAWPTGKVFTLAYAPDGLRLAAAGDRGNVVVWDTE